MTTRIRKLYVVLLATALATAVMLSAAAQTPPAQTPPVKKAAGSTEVAKTPSIHLHSAAEMMELLEKSTLMYELTTASDSMVATRPAQRRLTLDPKLHVKVTNGRPDLTKYEESPDIKQQYEFLNESNLAKNYRMSLGFSQKMLALDSNYNYARTLIGDAYYLLERYDSAAMYLREAIKHNYADFQAHWFLSDALLRLGDTGNAVFELTVAHVLNVNNVLLRESLKSYRKMVGRPLDEWRFDPYYTMKQHKDTVFVTFAPKDQGYAIAKAVWRYEPGYVEKMTGSKVDSASFRYMEEREAILCATATDSTLARRVDAAEEAGFFDEFMLYELAAPLYPEWIATMPGSMIVRLAEYVGRFH